MIFRRERRSNIFHPVCQGTLNLTDDLQLGSSQNSGEEVRLAIGLWRGWPPPRLYKVSPDGEREIGRNKGAQRRRQKVHSVIIEQRHATDMFHAECRRLNNTAPRSVVTCTRHKQQQRSRVPCPCIGAGLLQPRRLRPLNGPIRHPQEYSQISDC